MALQPDADIEPRTRQAKRAQSWRKWLLPLLSLTSVALSICAAVGVFYTGPKPQQERLKIVSVESNTLPGGSHSDLTTLPYLASTQTNQDGYAMSSATAALVKHGGWFRCTITKPVKDQIPRAAKCTPAPA